MTTTKLLLREVVRVDSECGAVMGYLRWERDQGLFHAVQQHCSRDQTTTFPKPFLLEEFLAEIAPLAYNIVVKDAEADLRRSVETLLSVCFEDALTYCGKKKKRSSGSTDQFVNLLHNHNPLRGLLGGRL